MNKRTFLWTIYFVACSVVIAAAIRAGLHHENCHECRQVFKGMADSRSYTVSVDK